jgi:hypothetical protein
MPKKYATRWNRIVGYKGRIRHVFDDHLQVCVSEDLRMLKWPYSVLEYSREISAHESLEEAKIEALRRLIALASKGLAPELNHMAAVRNRLEE